MIQHVSMYSHFLCVLFGLGASSVFGHKAESSASAVGGLGNPHDPWNRLHVAPPFSSGPAWAKGLEKRDDRDRGKDMGGRELTQIKDEKDRYATPPYIHKYLLSMRLSNYTNLILDRFIYI